MPKEMWLEFHDACYHILRTSSIHRVACSHLSFPTQRLSLSLSVVILACLQIVNVENCIVIFVLCLNI